jgi:hypothetical protein
MSFLFHIFFIHPISLPASFRISPRSFLSLSLLSLHPFHTCSIASLFIAHSAPSFLSFHPIPVFSLLVHTSKYRHHFSFSCTLSLSMYSGISFVIHLSYTLSSLFLAWLCLCPFHSALHSSIFLLLSIFPLLHWHTRSSGSISLSLLLLFFFFSLQHSVSTLPFHPFYLQTLPLSFLLSLSAYSSYILSSLGNLAFLCPLLASLSNIFLALSLSYSLKTSHYLFFHHFRLLSIHFQLFLPHILSQVLLHFFDFSITLCHNYQVIPKCQAPNLLSTYHTPPACAFFNISSKFAIYQGTSGQPCLTPFIVSNHSPSFSPTFTLFFVLSPQSSVPAIRFFLSLSFSYIQTFSLCLPC